MFRDSLMDQVGLESFVDQAGIEGVMEMLANICWDKAEHLRTQMEEFEARGWEEWAFVFSKLAS